MRIASIAFLYPSHYPVTGGSSVHGYFLAKGLVEKGYELMTFPQENDGFSACFEASPGNYLKAISKADLVYLRVSPSGRSATMVPWLRRFGKKTIVELNGPTDELKLIRNMSEAAISKLDRKLKKQVAAAHALVTVSPVMGEWCRKVLEHPAVHVVENGGMRYTDAANPPASLEEELTPFLSDAKQVVLWSGNAWPWQGVEWVKACVKLGKEQHFILVSDDPDMFRGLDELPNVKVLPRQGLDAMRYLISRSDAGLAFYGDYSWFRLGSIYNSSLKMYEYLANRLWVAGNHDMSRAPHYFCAQSAEEAIQWLGSRIGEKVPADAPYRSWQDVAYDTAEIIENVLAWKSQNG